MDSGYDLYPHYERALKLRKNAIEKSSIFPANKEALISFLNNLDASGVSKAQQISYLSRILPIVKLLGETTFKGVSKKRMEDVFAAWRNTRSYKQARV